MAASRMQKRPGQAPGRVIQSYVSSDGHKISLAQAADVWAQTIAARHTNSAAIAKRLQSELAAIGFALEPKDALQLVKRIVSNDVTVLVQTNAASANARSRYMLVLTAFGEELDRREFLTVWDAIAVLVSWTMASLPNGGEPALCQMETYSCGFDISVWPNRSDEFAFVLRRFEEREDEERYLCDVDHVELRLAAQGLVEKLSNVRPMLVFNDSFVPADINPLLVARFYLTGLEGGSAFAPVQEANLLQFFLWFECTSCELERGSWIVRSESRAFRIDVCWVDTRLPRAEWREIEEKHPEGLGDEIWDRYCEFLDATDGPFGKIKWALRVADKLRFEFDAGWLSVIDSDALSEAAHRHMLDSKRPMQVADIADSFPVGSERLMRLAPETVVKLARVFNTAPMAFLNAWGNRQQWVLVTTAETFEDVLSGATAFELAPSFGVNPPAHSLLVEARDLSRRIFFESQLGLADSLSETIRDAVFDLIAKADKADILLLMSRKTLFSTSEGSGSSEGRGYENVVYFDAKPC
ncbi:hypothetical protein [Caballeronia telluris]|uniref:Uncharacterized protein n=1 Tax=Caballeronia telluris TaxID=326475 RepID=A0A158KC85_9BURK|nr:hypothetical protein [Caballeronia telluris]SAL78645.1 hypothetical protein AWB66_05887 [Caballeronia telluris]